MLAESWNFLGDVAFLFIRWRRMLQFL